MIPVSRCAASEAGRRSASEKTRYWYVVAALLYTAGLAYGSWLPFALRPHVPGEVEQQVRRELAQPLVWSTGADFLSNGILGMPLGFLISGALRRPGWSGWLRLLPTAVICFIVGFTVEFGQFWVLFRIPSKADVVAQFCGSLAGCALEYACGVALVTQFVRIHLAAGSAETWRRLSLLYVIAYLGYALLPFDGLESTVGVSRRWGEFHSLGSSPPLDRGSLKAALLYAKKIAVYLPFGIAAYFSCRRKKFATMIACATAVGLLAATTVELLQLLLRSSTSDAGEIPCAAAGAATGAGFMHLFCRFALDAGLSTSTRAILTRAAGCMAALYFCGLCLLFWYPFKISTDPDRIVAQAELFFSWPLVGLWHGSNANAVAQVGLKIVCFGVLGGLLAVRYSCSEQTIRYPTLRVFFFVLAAGLVIEFGQIWSIDRFPDAFDAVLGAGGGLLAQRLTLLLMPRRSQHGGWESVAAAN